MCQAARILLYVVLSVSGMLAQAQTHPDSSALLAIRSEYHPLATFLASAPERIPTRGNRVELVPDGEQLLWLLTRDIMAAREFVHMDYFIFKDEPETDYIHAAMRLRALDGLEVRYIAEDFTQKKGYINRMRRSGVEVKHYRMFPLVHRNHQKLVVIDSDVAYTGGMNLARDYFYYWDDLSVRLQGPAVASVELLFDKMWRRLRGAPTRAVCSPPPVPGSDVIVQQVDDSPYDKENRTLYAFVWALDHAKEFFYAKSPYFAPPPELARALKEAAGRGVDVRLILPERGDLSFMDPVNRSYYKQMLDAGVKLYQRGDRFDHSKVFTSDNYLSCIGSSNMDGVSFRSNFENNLLFYDEDLAQEIRSLIEQNLARSELITPEYLQGLSGWERMGHGLLRVLGQWM